MKFNQEFINDKILPFANKVSTNRYLSAVNGGLSSMLPAILIGAIFSLVSGFPFEPYQNFLTNSGLKDIVSMPVTFTTNILALLAVFFIAYTMAKSFDVKGEIAGLLGLVCFLILTPTASFTVNENPAAFIPFNWLGATGLFTAIIVGLIVGRIYAFIIKKGIIIKMPSGVPPTIAQSFAGLIPGFVIVILFLIISAIFKATSFGSFHQFIYTFVQTPLQGLGGTFGAVIILILVIQIFWLFGIHGVMVVLPILYSIWLPLDIQNTTAYAAGQPLPNIVGFAFWGTYALVGGSGATLGLTILMAFRSKSKRYGVLGKLALLPGICNINEPIIFGTPIILNPILAIPFLLTPVLSATIAYVCTIIGLVPRCIGANLPLGTPVIVQGILQGSWKIAALQVLLMVFSALCYLPFFKMIDKKAKEEEISEENGHGETQTV